MTQTLTGNRPRLLILGPLPPPVGGVENFTKTLLESDKFGGFETLHCNMTKGRPKQTQGKFDLGNFVWALIHFRRVQKALKSFRPDVVYTPLTSSWSGFLRDGVIAWLAKRNSAKVIGHVHGSRFPHILRLTGKRERTVRKVLSRFDMLLMLGTPLRDAVVKYGYEGPVLVVPSTTRREVFERGRSVKHDYSRAFPGLFVGQVGKRKGVYDLLAAAKALCEEGLDLKLILVGPGEFEGDWAAVHARTAELGLEEVVEFTGPIQGDDLYAKLSEAAFFILPSYDEGLPAVFFEAGAFGLPCIGTPVGAITDLLKHNANGLLVTPGSVSEIAGAIRQLAGSEELRCRLGTALASDVLKFHPDEVCELIAQAVRRALAA